MYKDNDVLAQVLEDARKDLGQGENTKGLPDKPPKYGTLDIQGVREDEYAFARAYNSARA
jgi:hypothetical protein